jgi:hypothetical protein
MSAAPTTDTQPSSAGAPPVADTKDALTGSANANFAITAYAHALANVTLQQLPSQGDWYATFVANLATAQTHAQRWVQDLGPAVFAKVPQAVIDYSNVFVAATDDVLGILGAIDGVPTPAQQQQINALLGALLTKAQTAEATLAQLQVSLTGFASDIEQDHTNLLTGQHSAQQEILDDQNLADQINAQITSMNATIASDSAKALASEIGLGIAIFVTVVAIGLAVATDGAALPLVVAGVGVLGIGGAIAGTVVFTEAVNQDIDDLHALQQQLSDEQRQVTALQGVSDTIGGLVTANVAAQSAMAEVLDAWSTLSAKLATVVQDVESAEAPDLPARIEALDLKSAQQDWQDLVAFATGMQASAQSVTTQVAQQPAVTAC